ncbi:beta-phosphoglucomutase [Mycoplasmopsis felis]|nr:beta-phosphoglucomutase [Mycoplasmopsis felis]MCU9931792.1 beta-phosphoglucomutase [Mycoplasmopsis felis]MCU9937742.1 beta-phosphoglucomutase [Mycoplasmopsis felis]WAM02533.1 beta-phosphoglucomutase [Mycoplasmopsis felis]
MIKGFVFDLDGVITDTAVLHYKSLKEVVKN